MLLPVRRMALSPGDTISRALAPQAATQNKERTAKRRKGKKNEIRKHNESTGNRNGHRTK